MTRRKMHVAVVGLVLVAVVSLVSLTRSYAQLGGKSVASPTRVAVCDLVKVFSEYQRAKDLTDKLNERKDGVQAENNRRLKKQEELKTELDGFVVGSKKYDEVLEKWRRESIEQQVWLQMEQATLLNEHRRLTEEMFGQIKEAVATVAKERGIELVIQLSAPEVKGAQSVEQLIARIDRQRILFNTEELDITPVVLQRLNESYRIKKD